MLNKDQILNHLKEIKPKLTKDGIVNLGLFGSYAKDTNDIASDIDIALETTDFFRQKFKGFEAIIYLENLRDDLEKHFKKNVDFCNIAGFKNSPEKKDIILDKVIYV